MSTSPLNKSKYSAPALSKGLDILEFLSDKTEGLNLSQIAQGLNRSKGEIFRMLCVLNERGYIDLDAHSDTYSITLQLFQMAHKQPIVGRLSAIANPIMTDLIHNIKQSCHLAIFYNGQVIVVAQHDSMLDRRFGVRLGATADIINSCSGHVLYALADQTQKTQIENLASPAVNQALKSSIMQTNVARIQQQGYEQMKSGQVVGVIDIGYPIYDYSGKVVAALIVPYLEHYDDTLPVTLDAARIELGKAAIELSHRLGKT